MNPAIEASELLHKWFENEEHQYSEYEPSDVEYFVAVFLYNQFKFEKAVKTMQTMDVGSDFLDACGTQYNEMIALVNSVKFDNDEEAVVFLLDFIHQSQAKYTKAENYLLDRIEKHIILLQERYIQDSEVPEPVNFEVPQKKLYNF